MKIFKVNLSLSLSSWNISIVDLIVAPSQSDAEQKARRIEAEYNSNIVGVSLPDVLSDDFLSSLRNQASVSMNPWYELASVELLEDLEGSDGKIHKLKCYNVE